MSFSLPESHQASQLLPESEEAERPAQLSNSVIVQLLSCVWLFATLWTAAHQASLSFTIFGTCSNSCSLSWWCHPTISSSVFPFSSCLQSFLASGSFPMSQFLLLHFSPVAHWAPADLRSSSFSVLSFCLFTLSMGFLRQEYWSGLPFPSLVDHVLSELCTMTCPSWVALHGVAHRFIELDKAVVHAIAFISVLCLWFYLLLISIIALTIITIIFLLCFISDQEPL